MIVDASVWVSSQVPEEHDHWISLEWLERQARRRVPLIIPALALTEVAGAVARASGDRARGREAVETIKAIATLQIVSLNDLLMERATTSPPVSGLGAPMPFTSRWPTFGTCPW